MSLNKINILAFLVVMLGTVGSARAAPASEKVFLVIHSYDPEMGITRHEDEGAVKAFEANKMADLPHKNGHFEKRYNGVNTTQRVSNDRSQEEAAEEDEGV